MSDRHVVLVCGGRMYGVAGPLSSDEAQRQAWLEQAALSWFLSGLHAVKPISLLVHGRARGADTFAGWWAAQNKVPVSSHAADWATHGKSAGSIRNQHMLHVERPDLVVATAGGRGTEDMIRKAEQRGVRVVRVPYPGA